MAKCCVLMNRSIWNLTQELRITIDSSEQPEEKTCRFLLLRVRTWKVPASWSERFEDYLYGRDIRWQLKVSRCCVAVAPRFNDRITIRQWQFGRSENEETVNVAMFRRKLGDLHGVSTRRTRMDAEGGSAAQPSIRTKMESVGLGCFVVVIVAT